MKLKLGRGGFSFDLETNEDAGLIVAGTTWGRVVALALAITGTIALTSAFLL